MDFHIIVNTYKREEMCKKLVEQLNATNFSIRIQVYVDGHGPPFPDYGKCNTCVIWQHHGKENYYKLVQKGFKGRQKAKYYLKLDDDVKIVPGFFDKCVEAWESIYDPNKLTLNLLQDGRRGLWRSGEPEDFNKHVLKTQWVDLNFMCDETFMKRMDSMELGPPPEFIKSSGVARQISKRMRLFGNMYQVKESLLVHGDHPSVMNPERKEKITNI